MALVGGFSAAQFLFYVVAPAVIRATSATALNLALFTTDFYILITGIALFKFKVCVRKALVDSLRASCGGRESLGEL